MSIAGREAVDDPGVDFPRLASISAYEVAFAGVDELAAAAVELACAISNKDFLRGDAVGGGSRVDWSGCSLDVADAGAVPEENSEAMRCTSLI